MTWFNRFRLFFGIIFVVALVGALLVYLDYSLAHVTSSSAQIMSNSYTVGTDYSGIVTKQYVQEGQHVLTGQPLFEIQSSVLAADLANGTVNKDAVSYTINGNNDIVLKATENGTVSSIMYLQGAFVPASKEVATITVDGSLYVQAKYLLAPPDYARLKNGNILTVTLPNDQKVQATVFDISVQSNNNNVETIVKAHISGLTSSSSFTAGTPVSAQLKLDGKTLYDSLSEEVNKIIKPKG